jgi:hypothetical protein
MMATRVSKGPAAEMLPDITPVAPFNASAAVRIQSGSVRPSIAIGNTMHMHMSTHKE